MPTSTGVNQKQLTLFRPRENALYKRFGFDRKNIRYEFSNSVNLDLVDKWIEDEPSLYLNSDSVDLADETGEGEGGSAGVSFFLQDGDRVPTTRYARGFSILEEEIRAGNDSISDQVTAIMELFDFQYDKNFLTGYYRGNEWVPGIFEFLDENIPSSRVFDCSAYTSGGSETDYQTPGTQENLIKYDAFNAISNELMSVESPRWGSIVGVSDALNNFNKVSDSSNDRASYWDRLNTNDSAGVGIDRPLYMPKELKFSRAASGQDPISVDLTAGNANWDGLGSDEAYLLPPMNMLRGTMWELAEMSTPEMFNAKLEVGKRRFDYISRYNHDFNISGNHADCTDIVKLTNISALFS